MKVTGQIICTRTLKADAPERPHPRPLIRPAEDFDVHCEWKGGPLAAIHVEIFEGADPRHFEQTGEDTYRMCQFNLRVVGESYGVGTYADLFIVMRDGVAARLLSFANRKSRCLLNRLMRWDVALYRLFGYPLREGTCIPRLSLSYVLIRLWNPSRWEIA